MKNPVAWFEIYVDDMARAKRFYEQVFDVTLSRIDNPDIEIWAFPADYGSYGAAGALVGMPGFSPARNSTIVYFSCKDCDREAQRAVEQGGAIHKPKTSIGQYGQIAMLIDTEGNMIGLHSM